MAICNTLKPKKRNVWTEKYNKISSVIKKITKINKFKCRQKTVFHKSELVIYSNCKDMHTFYHWNKNSIYKIPLEKGKKKSEQETYDRMIRGRNL